MKCRIALITGVVALLAFAPAGWSQMVPDANPRLAPSKSTEHPTSSESLEAQAQDLTKKIDAAKAQGKDTTTATAEQTQAEKSMQQGNEQDALRHFQAGEQALGMGDSQAPNTP
jgi:hypothetical protein